MGEVMTKRRIVVVLTMGCLALTMLSTLNANAASLQFSDVIKKDQTTEVYCPDQLLGHACHMSRTDAEAYCKSIGGHLPSVWEMDDFLKSQGGGGVRRSLVGKVKIDEPSWDKLVSEVNSLPGYFRFVFHENDDSYWVELYYNNSNFRLQKNDGWLWTTTLSDFRWNGERIYLVRSDNGQIFLADSNFQLTHAVRCVLN
jgi:hypothetical protein